MTIPSKFNQKAYQFKNSKSKLISTFPTNSILIQSTDSKVKNQFQKFPQLRNKSLKKLGRQKKIALKQTFPLFLQEIDFGTL